MRLRAQDGLSGVSACIGSRFHSGGGALSNACRRTPSSTQTLWGLSELIVYRGNLLSDDYTVADLRSASRAPL